MALTGRGAGLARSALAISRCTRHPGDGCSSVVVTGRLKWIPGTHQCNSITTVDDHTTHLDGNQHTGPSVAESHDLEGNNKSMFHQQGLAFGNGHRAAGNGLARGEPSPPPPSVTPLSEESNSSQAIEAESPDNTQVKRNWMNYQAGLQMRAGLRDLANAGHGSSGNGGGTCRELNAKRHGHKLTRNDTPRREFPLSGGKLVDSEATEEETNAIGSGEIWASPGYDGANAYPKHGTQVDNVHPEVIDFSDGISEDTRGKRWKRRVVIEKSADDNENGPESIESGKGESASLSHFERAGSAWTNVHAKANLRALMKGLANDYGVTQGAKERNVSKRTFNKVLSIFTSLVLEDPNTAFPGEAGQRVQQDITKLCFDPGFRTDAVMRRRPVRIAGGIKSPVDIEIAGRKASSPFATARSKLMMEVFIPRIVQLAEEHYPNEVASARIMFEATDLTNPHEWYPIARLRKRRIIYHGGPTNSGKTYSAITRLKEAGANRKPGDPPAGIFCGPLRLLALEVYEQLNSQGVYCSLNTGQEKREVPFATHVSCTIEMASTTTEYEVAVIDEIQMIADGQRGQIWTAALLGLNCPEIHLCGGLEAAKLVEALAADMGDDFELRQYERKTALVCAEQSLRGSYANVQPGDAVVAFSRKDIFAIKREIERKTPYKCCIVYGTLPQETRANQARLFNTEGSGYDVLVASDAIGMGLNLNIRRVVFHSVNKRTPRTRGSTPLSPTLLKQIGGRAGRHGKKWDFGEVTCFRDNGMAYMKRVMETPLEPIAKARMFPMVQRVQAFANCLEVAGPETVGRRRLGDILELFASEAKVGDRFILGEHDHQQKIADAMHSIENLTLEERFMICMAPVNQRNEELVRAVTLFAAAHAKGLPAFVNMHLPPEGALPRSVDEFQGICTKHAVLEAYKWMANRFPGLECSAELALAERQKTEVVSIIQEALKEDILATGKSSIGLHLHDQYDSTVLDEIQSQSQSQRKTSSELEPL